MMTSKIKRMYAVILVSSWTLLSSTSMADAKPVREHAVTVCEKMLIPFLTLLQSDYDKADEKLKRRIEYSAYLANRTYWINTHKFNHKRSELIERSLGSLNNELLSENSFRLIFTDWEQHAERKDFPSSGKSYYTELKNGEKLKLDIKTIEDWERLHRELLSFVEEVSKPYADR